MHRALRIKNLIIILLTQWFVWYFVFKQSETIAQSQTAMEWLDVLLLGIVTILLALGAYIINDVYDLEADAANGLERVKDKRYSVLQYWGINFIGLVLALIVAYRTQSIGLIWIYPASVLILYAYSRFFKGTPLLGNVIVGLFCALVPGILFLAERHMIDQWKLANEDSWELHKGLMWMFILFSFISTVYREQVKDLEDQEGDKAAGYYTLPIVYGEGRARALAIFSGLILIFSVALYSSYNWHNHWLQITTMGLTLLLTLLSLSKLYRQGTRQDYYQASQWIKYAMLTGTIFLLTQTSYLH